MRSAPAKTTLPASSSTAIGTFKDCLNLRTLGFAFFSVWQNAAFAFLFPSSSGQIVSPVFIGHLGAAFLLAFCWLSYTRDRATFSPAWCIGLSFIATIAAVIADVLVAQSLLPLWGIYLASGVMGFSTATVLYVWATAFQGLSTQTTLMSVGLAFFVASVLDLAAMNSGYFTIPVLISIYGTGSWLCYLLSMRSANLDSKPILVRPQHTREFIKMGIGVVLSAFALGIVAGTTADVCTEESMRVLNQNIGIASISVSFILLVSLYLGNTFSRRHIEALTLLRVFAPCLVVVILLNIVFLNLADLWLCLTIFSWSLLRLCIFLILLEIDRHHIVSLPLAFPSAWAILSCGYAAGIFTGQNIVPLAGDGSQQLMNTIVLVAVLVVVGAMLLLSNRVVLSLEDSGDPVDVDSNNTDANVAGKENQVVDQFKKNASSAEPVRTLEERCQQIATRNKLSARESEVFFYLAQGHTRASIAKRLFVSENTVREHVKSIYRKLHIHSKQQLIDLVDARS